MSTRPKIWQQVKKQNCRFRRSRRLGLQRLIASCLNDACRHVALIDVSSYPADTEVPWFRSRVKCAKCGGRGKKIDVRPNWSEQRTQPSLVGKEWR
jgi:hypothetical protein